jgi:hypothetical protein
MIERAYLESPLQDIPKLLRLHIAGVLNLQVPSLGYNLLRSERSFGVSPSRICPPFLHCCNFVQILLLLSAGVHSGVGHLVCHDG